MSKLRDLIRTLQIVLFLILSAATGLARGGDAHPSNHRVGLQPLRVALVPVAAAQPSETPSRSVDDDVTGLEILGWAAVGVLLLVLPLLALLRIRSLQAQARELRMLREHVNRLYHHAPNGYHTVDENGTIVNINETLLNWLGYTRDEVVGKMKFKEILDGGEGPLQPLVDKRSSKTSVKLIQKSGGRFPVVLQLGESDGRRSDFSAVDNRECEEALERIKTLDHELESFSYSISHDLRAPLRSIDGYSRILQEDHAATLGDEGGRVLSVIVNNAKRMANLIDDLLEFGRLGRKKMTCVPIDMTGMVRTVINDLMIQIPDRKVDISVEPLLSASADPEMIRQVWYNLLHNAIKFTSRAESALIEVKSLALDTGEVCYEVRDNGVGFDMKYASKLYGVFQRLHKIQDFPGTGVGLAIVKRIVSRHGGRVWAEASLEHGAVFYFIIPNNNENAGRG